MRIFFSIGIVIASLLPCSAQYGKVNVHLGPNGTRGTMHYYQFSENQHTLKVVDQGPKTPLYRNLDAAMRGNGCIAGTNGGFTGSKGTPLGLVISNGRMRGSSNKNSVFTSATIYVDKGTIRLVKTSTFAAKSPPLPRNVLQAGPFLLEQGKPSPGLQTNKFSRRTVLLTNGRGSWVLAYTPPATLSELAALLQKKTLIPNFQPAYAVNLSGGSASGLWIRRTNTPLYFREAGRVSHFLGVVPKAP